MTTPVTLTVAQALVYAKTSTAPLIIRDSNANIAASADALVALGAQIVSLQGDNGEFYARLNAADLLVLATKTYYHGSLETFSSIYDTATPIAVNATALEAFAAGVIQLGNGLSISINDSAAHVGINAIALQSLAAGLAQDAYYNYFNSNSLAITINDTAADVASNATALQTLALGLAQDSYIAGLLNNNRLTLTISDTAAQIAANATALQALAAGLAQAIYNDGNSNNSHLNFTINDTAAHVAAQVAALQTLAAGLAQDSYLSGRINNNHLILTISDTAAQIAVNATALQALAAGLAQATYNDGNSNNNQLDVTISDTSAQVAAHATALQALAAGWAQATYSSGYANNSHLNFTISDTAAHVTANATALQALAAGLVQDGYGTNNNNQLTLTISDTAAHVTANSTVLQALAAGLAQDTYGSINIQNNNYLTLSVSDTAAQVVANAVALQTLAAGLGQDTFGAGFDNNSLTITITDTFSNILSDINTINALPVPIKGIKLTNGGIPSKTLTASHYAADAAVLAQIITPYHLTISGEVAANVAGDIKNRHVTAIGVVDTAANVLAVLDSALAPNNAKLSGIALTDTGIPTLAITATQFAHDAAVLGKISTHYSLGISGETAANVVADAKDSHVKAIAVLDSAADVTANLSSLASNIGKLSGIALTDKAIPTLSLTAAQVSGGLGALNAITSPYLLSIKDTLFNISSLSLSSLQSHAIEIVPTSLPGMLFETSQVADLNFSLIKLSGDTISEKVYHGNGTELDIMAGNVSLVSQLFFTHDTESQLQLLGVGKTIVHVI